MIFLTTMNTIGGQDKMDSLVHQASNIKSSPPKSIPSNPKIISGSATRGVAPVCNFVRAFIAVVGRRKDAEVAERIGKRGAGVGFVSELEVTRPVTVAGRIEALMCSGFLVGTAMGPGSTRISGWTSDVWERIGCFRGCGLGVVATRARDTAGAPFVPLVVRLVCWVVCGALADVFEASPTSRGPAKGLGSSAYIKAR